MDISELLSDISDEDAQAAQHPELGCLCWCVLAFIVGICIGVLLQLS